VKFSILKPSGSPAHIFTFPRNLSGTSRNVDKFVRFINLMINDVTYLMDESLSDLQQMHNIQKEMDNKEAWAAQTAEHRREQETALRTLERHAGGYISLGRSTVGLLKVFTAQAKTPFMMPEIVDRLAAMLDYNLVALVGPKYQVLQVRDKEKLRFNPRELLSDMLQVFLNLSDQQKFVEAVANDGRSYSKELFESAEEIALLRGLKSKTEVEQLRVFVEKVEEAKANIEAEEDLGEVPDEYLGTSFSTGQSSMLMTIFLSRRPIDVHGHERPCDFTVFKDYHR
jgi:ubiquitin conjugation factor E4 B